MAITEGQIEERTRMKLAERSNKADTACSSLGKVELLKSSFEIEPEMFSNMLKKNLVAQRGARTHDPEIKSLVLYRLS